MPTGHYFDASPGAPSRPSQVELRLPDAVASLTVDRGVFSGTRVDPGTVALLRAETVVAPAGHLLDLGCGYGPIACTLARRAPGATVWAVDVNQRALALTRANAASLGLTNLVAADPDGVPGDVTFAEIWSNPPIRIGKEALHELLDGWLARLVPEGRALLVVHRHLGGDSLADWLTGAGWVVARRASKQGYRVLEARRQRLSKRQ
ncbi:MAG: class I SAM-dependent methyltransferase [Acidimicrobiaceae bacterium]|nr:class I SAM-dependent methyltransferase [Acidimicrobiaceae bacterium]